MWNLAYAGHLPIQGTEIAREWDVLYWFIMAISVFFFAIVIGGMILFAIKYRSKEGAKSSYIHGHVPLEITWTIIPTILLLVIFGWGWVVYRDMTQPPIGAYEVRVIGKQWLWQFQYPDGRSTINELYFPANKPVKLIMTSEDVLHSFFIPNFRVKKDVVPGMYTSVWFNTKTPGRHQIYCTEYCGTSHSGMLAVAYALDEKQWAEFERGKKPQIPLAEGGATGSKPALKLADIGKQLTKTKGCIACHTEDGSQLVGPSYKGLFGKEREFADGSKATADENYLIESINEPQKRLVKGFQPVMPVFQGQLSAEDLNAIVEYIKSVK